MIGRTLMLCILLCTGQMVAFAQTRPDKAGLSNLRKSWYSIKSDTLVLDSLSLVPNTISILAIPDSLYRVDFVNGTLIWKTRPALDSVLVMYRVYATRSDFTSMTTSVAAEIGLTAMIS
ncbi:MAG: hypothetical protein EOP49_36095 [Sphingobacteriales bacterium]|nr:MAG: hypothetical protein EOP49_36095 [Sphingobacteriales bacterium]